MLFQCLQIKENHFWDDTFRFNGDTEIKIMNYYCQLLEIILRLQEKELMNY